MGGEASQRGEGTVLRVTGDPTRAATFERQIAVRTGYRVRTANSVGAALGHLDGGEEEQVVAVVADADLADADGVALLEFIRAECPALPVLLRTGDGRPQTDARAARAGVTRVLPDAAYDGAWESVTALLERAVAAGGGAATAGGSVAPGRASDPRQNGGSEPTPGAVPADGRPDGRDTSAARHVLDGALDGIVVSVRGEVAYANRRGRDAFDVRPGVPLRAGPALDRVERIAGDISADGGWQVGDGPRPVERFRTAIPGEGGPTPVDLTAARIRWDGAPATTFVLREPGSAEDRPPEGRVAALDELLDRLRTDIGTLLGGTELLGDRVDESGRTHLESLISTARTAVARAETAGAIAGSVRDGSGPTSIRLGPTLEGAIETVRTGDPGADIAVEGSIPAISVAADESLEPALAFLLREVAHRDDADRVRIGASLSEPGTAVEVRVAVEDGGEAAPAAGPTRTVEPGGSAMGEDERRASFVAHLLEDVGGRLRVSDDGTGPRAYRLEVPTVPDREERPVSDGSWRGERV